MATQFLRLTEVRGRIGVSKSTIYQWMQSDSFPRPVKLGARSVAWQEIAIDEWMATRVDASQGGAR